jgi:hypothetical protein
MTNSFSEQKRRGSSGLGGIIVCALGPLRGGHIRRCQSLDVSIQREHFPLKSDEPKANNLSQLSASSNCSCLSAGRIILHKHDPQTHAQYSDAALKNSFSSR